MLLQLSSNRFFLCSSLYHTDTHTRGHMGISRSLSSNLQQFFAVITSSSNTTHHTPPCPAPHGGSPSLAMYLQLPKTHRHPLTHGTNNAIISAQARINARTYHRQDLMATDGTFISSPNGLMGTCKQTEPSTGMGSSLQHNQCGRPPAIMIFSLN